jgi:hypothetical protein
LGVAVGNLCGRFAFSKAAVLPRTSRQRRQPIIRTLSEETAQELRDRLAFSGTGSYNGQAGATWKIAGFVDRNQLRAVIEYTGTLQPGYKVFLAGKVAADGSVAGTARSSQGQGLTFTMPTGAFASVLHYHAAIQSDQIGRHDATFRFTIPRGEPAGLAGVKVTVKVHDGGWGRAHDTYAHGVTGTPLSPYPITGGPGVTVR